MKRIVQLVRVALLTLVLGVALNNGAAVAYAQAPVHGTVASITSSKEEVCQGAGITKSCTGASALNSVVKAVLNLLSLIVGVAAVIMIIISGFRYITSGGDASKVSAAKSALIYAIIGLIIVALAQLIVRFVFTKATA